MGLGIGWSVYRLVVEPVEAWHAAAIFLFCLAVTDLISGLLHIVLDNPRSMNVPLLRGLAGGFQRHHERPSRIYEMSLYEHLYVMHLPLTIVFLAVVAVDDGALFTAFLSLVVSLHLMQMAHLWAHLPAPRVPAPVRRLQRWGLLVGNREHGRHHTPPYSRDFCILSGWFNPPLNAVVRLLGPTSHWWNAAFLASCLLPLGFAFLLASGGS